MRSSHRRVRRGLSIVTHRFRRRAAVRAARPFLFAVAAVLVCASATFSDPVPDLTLAEIVELHDAGVGADVLLARIEVSDNALLLDAEDILWLRSRGVSNEVIAALVRTASVRGTDLDYDDRSADIDVVVTEGASSRVIIVDEREYWPSLWTWAFSAHWPIRYSYSYAYHYPYQLAYWHCYPGWFGYLRPHYATCTLYGSWGVRHTYWHRDRYDPYRSYGPRFDGRTVRGRTLAHKGDVRGDRGRSVIRPDRDAKHVRPGTRGVVRPQRPGSRPQVKPGRPGSRPQMKPGRPGNGPQVKPSRPSTSRPQVKPKSPTRPKAVRPTSKSKSKSGTSSGGRSGGGRGGRPTGRR